MALSEAEKRRRRFLKEKKDAGGDIQSLQAKIFNRDFNVNFDKDGNILGYSQEKITKKRGTFLQTFKREQVEILKGKNTDLFMVKQDPIETSVYSIDRKPIESIYVRTEKEFVSLIEISSDKTFNITISFDKNKLFVQMHKTTKNKFKKVKSAEATIEGTNILKFYFSSVNDPHFLIHTINVKLQDLLEQDKVEIKVPPRLYQCSVYTLKLFDKYVRS